MIKDRGSGKLPVFMYHEVADNKPDFMQRSYCITVKQFQLQLETLNAQGFETVLIEDLDGDKKPPKKAVALTFDDGFKGNVIYALPALKQYGYNATFFVTPQLIGQSGYMTWDDCSELVAAGMSVQSHGYSHEPLETLALYDAIDELKLSKWEIEKQINNKISCISFPHGSYNRRILKAGNQLGYKKFAVSETGYHRRGEIIKRVVVTDSMSNEKFVLLARGKIKPIIKSVLGQFLRRNIRRAIGINNYRRIYRLVFKIKKR